MSRGPAPSSHRTTRFALVGDNTIDAYVGEIHGEYVGGNALNCAVQLASRGAEVEYYGAVGDDAAGCRIATCLRDRGVRPTGLVIVPGHTALTMVRVLPSGERVFEREDFGVTAEYFPADGELDRIAEADWVHIGMLVRAAELVRVLRERRPTIRISQDCAVSRGHAGLTVAFESAGESGDAARMAREAIAGGAEATVVTRGPRGALALDPTGEWPQPAVPASVIDTTGAGDSFIAGFINTRAQGGAMADALASGATWAALTCGHLAGFPQE